jgi:superoxide reductase
MSERIQTADWKAEKHVPVIDCPDTVSSTEPFEVKVTLGKAAAHPNTTEHHIRWITLYFHPEGEKFTTEVGQFTLSAHGESVKGPNEGPVYSNPTVSTNLRISKPGTLHAVALCNIHGLWESSKEIRLV